MREILLTQGEVALVDDEDYDFLNQFNWHVQKKKTVSYAIGHKTECRKRTTIRMHREIMKEKLTGKLQVDHIDHNGLNNQKSNLRIVTNRENLMNLKNKQFHSSIYTGVTFSKRDKLYKARMWIGNKCYNLGDFKDELKAAIVYMQAVYGPNYLYE
jgi:hypothetical protein